MTQNAALPTSESMQWTCPNCGTEHIQGDVCPACGTLHGTARSAAKIHPSLTLMAVDAPLESPKVILSARQTQTALRVAGGCQAAFVLITIIPFLIFGVIFVALFTEKMPTDTATAIRLGALAFGSLILFLGISAAIKSTQSFKETANAAYTILSTQEMGIVGKSPSNEPFLFNKANQRMVEGTSRRIASSMGNLLFVSILLITAIIVYAVSADQWNFITRLGREGHTTQAVVTNRYTTRSSGKNASTTYHIAFQFVATAGKAEGQTISAEQTVSSDAYNRLAPGTSIEVRFLPDDPHGVRLAGKFADDSGYLMFLIFAIIFVAISGLLMLWQVRYMLRNRRLVQTGQLLKGQVVKCGGKRSKNSYSINLAYTFQTPDGRWLKRTEKAGRNDLRASMLPSAGTPVTVLYADDQTYRVM